MKIVVLIKQVPNTNEVKVDMKTGVLIRDGVESIINPDDKFALEAALRLKDKDASVHITAISMGPPQAEVALREALAMGCDEAILVTDRLAGGSDTWATSLILAAAVRKVGAVDLIFAGRQAIDGDTAQVGPQVAEKLDLPQVTYVNHLELKGDKAVVHRALEDGYHLIEVKLPCVLTAIGGLGEPRYPRFTGIFEAYQKEVPWWNMQDLGLATSKEIGLEGSPTKVHKSFAPKLERAGEVFPEATKDTVSELVSRLRDRHLV
ncbi:MAG: electron transfer flavoprotein subunit beta/FixA family protein [Oscillospiraceae bacterium]|nr:electron transfer flavoprotein subunit beta/FixA family protein [Oscillospiraceae bacterium]